MGGREARSYSDIGILVDMSGGGGGVDDTRDIPLTGQTPSSNGRSLRYTSSETTVKAFEDSMLNNRTHEELRVVDGNGFVVGASVGGKGSVGITARTAANAKGNIMTHNHPRSDDGMHGGTFSTADISVMAKYGIGEIRATAREGTYSLRAGTHADVTGFYNDLMSANTQRQLQRQMLAAGRRINPADFSDKKSYRNAVFNAQVGVYGNWYKNNAKRYGLIYTFEKRK